MINLYDKNNGVLAILEDEWPQIYLIEDYLNENLPGFEWTISRAGDEFEEKFDATIPPPRLSILDVLTPPPNGVDVLAWLKLYHPECVVVMFSTSVLEREECLQLGADGYYIKPESPSLVGPTLVEIIERHYPCGDEEDGYY